MIKKFVAAICLLSSLVMTGWTMANLPRVEKYPDLTKAEDFIIKGESDVKAVREIFGAPTIYGRTQNEDHLVYGYAIIGEKEYGVSFAESILESFKTLGLGKHPPRGSVYTQKNIYFKFDNNNKVEDIQYRGYAWLHPEAAFRVYLMQVLTDEEYKASNLLTVEQLSDSYSSKYTSEENIKKYDLSKSIEGIIVFYRLCAVGANNVFENSVLIIDQKVPTESYDGIKSSLLFDKVDFNYK